ncbi:CU044_2847 family protein [Nonomuraea sp. 10N515B]|uniref:CU044_2847 family protein n=1 Tax=Nonomuraea sp. 10N515B TaxID=3457422 RepID=UPI003FCE11CC
MRAGDSVVYLHAVRAPGEAGTEVAISGLKPTLEQALAGLSEVTERVSEKLRTTDASKVAIEFGCEFALESGKLVAMIGKGSARSTFKVTMEWSNPAP